MNRNGYIEIEEIQKLYAQLDFPTEPEPVHETFLSTPPFVPAWNFGEQPDYSVYSSSALFLEQNE